MNALRDYARGNLGRNWGRPHSLRRRWVNQLLAGVAIIGSWLVVMVVAGAAFFIAASPFLGTVIRFLETAPPARTAPATSPPDTLHGGRP